MRQVWIALGVAIFAVAASGCDDDGGRSASCYPAFPSVAPTTAPAGGVVTVTSDGWSGCRGSAGSQYGLWIGANSVAAFEHQGERVGTVRVDRAGTFAVAVRIPSTAAKGPHTITVGRLPDDHEEHGCDDTSSCGIQPSNLVVTGPP